MLTHFLLFLHVLNLVFMLLTLRLLSNLIFQIIIKLCFYSMDCYSILSKILSDHYPFLYSLLQHHFLRNKLQVHNREKNLNCEAFYLLHFRQKSKRYLEIDSSHRYLSFEKRRLMLLIPYSNKEVKVDLQDSK